MSTYVEVVISPATTTRPVVTSVSQATLLMGSSASAASRMVSEIWSAILSGWPSVTDSEVKRWEAFSFWSSAAFQVVIPTVFSAILYSPRFRLKSSPPPFYVSRSHGEERLRRHVLRLICRSLLRRSWHLPRGLTISLAGCRGFTGPVPPPLSMSAAGRPACLAGYYITSGRRMQCPPARISCGFRAAHLAATLSLPRRDDDDNGHGNNGNGNGHCKNKDKPGHKINKDKPGHKKHHKNCKNDNHGKGGKG